MLVPGANVFPMLLADLSYTQRGRNERKKHPFHHFLLLLVSTGVILLNVYFLPQPGDNKMGLIAFNLNRHKDTSGA